MCFNKKVLGGLALVALAVLVFAPSALWAALPLLVFLACPLSMFLMMRSMSRGQGQCGRGGWERQAQVGQEGRTEGGDAEVARLRAEVDQLRAEREVLRGDDAPVAESNRPR